MPEIIEIEIYRRLADGALDRPIVGVDAPDAWFLKDGLDSTAVSDALVGRSFTATRRIGKLLLLDTDGPTLGLRFGMTGRLLVDGDAAIDRLEYSSGRNDPAWDRFSVRFDDGGDMALRDPRRLGGVVLDPDESALGTDVWDVGAAQLAEVLGASRTALKTRLMDQKRLAGLGNLLTDESLWRAGLDPGREAGSLRETEVTGLADMITETVAELFERGGSHTGDLQEQRSREGHCPRDGTALERRTIGGRTTYSCPLHQV